MVISAEKRGKVERERLCRAGACGAALCYRLWSSGGDIIQKVPTSVASIPAAMARAIHSCRLMINPLANVLPTRESVDSVASPSELILRGSTAECGGAPTRGFSCETLAASFLL